MTDPTLLGRPDGMHTDEGRALFAEFRALPEGPRRRAMLSRLIVANAPLLRTMTGQMLGISRGPRHRSYRALGGCQGFGDLEWDDAFSAGMVALQKAFEQFTPSCEAGTCPCEKPNGACGCKDKGKFAPYLKFKLRYELQRLVDTERLVRVRRGEQVEAPSIALMGDQQLMDDLSGGAEDAMLAEASGNADFDIDRSGDIELTREQMGDIQVANDYDARPWLRAFVEDHLVFRSAARQARAPIVARYERVARYVGAFASTATLWRLLSERDVRPAAVRVPWSEQPVSGYRGVELRAG